MPSLQSIIATNLGFHGNERWPGVLTCTLYTLLLFLSSSIFFVIPFCTNCAPREVYNISGNILPSLIFSYKMYALSRDLLTQNLRDLLVHKVRREIALIMLATETIAVWSGCLWKKYFLTFRAGDFRKQYVHTHSALHPVTSKTQYGIHISTWKLLWCREHRHMTRKPNDIFFNGHVIVLNFTLFVFSRIVSPYIHLSLTYCITLQVGTALTLITDLRDKHDDLSTTTSPEGPHQSVRPHVRSNQLQRN